LASPRCAELRQPLNDRSWQIVHVSLPFRRSATRAFALRDAAGRERKHRDNEVRVAIVGPLHIFRDFQNRWPIGSVPAFRGGSSGGGPSGDKGLRRSAGLVLGACRFNLRNTQRISEFFVRRWPRDRTHAHMSFARTGIEIVHMAHQYSLQARQIGRSDALARHEWNRRKPTCHAAFAVQIAARDVRRGTNRADGLPTELAGRILCRSPATCRPAAG